MSSVTAVPLRPIKKGSLTKFWLAMALVTAGGAGLAVWGTRTQQVTTTESGIRYRILDEGEGPAATDADLLAVAYEVRLPDGTVVGQNQPNQPAYFSATNPIPNFGEPIRLMHKGGVYQFFIPASTILGPNPPPNSPVPADATLEVRVRVLDLAPGMAALQGMIQQQQAGGGGMGGPGGPGGPGGGMPPGMENPHGPGGPSPLPEGAGPPGASMGPPPGAPEGPAPSQRSAPPGATPPGAPAPRTGR